MKVIIDNNTIFIKLKKKYICLLFIIIPPILLVYCASIFLVNIPFWDEWELPLLFEIYSGDKLTISDLFKQHNEHRIFFPRIIFLLLFKLNLWDTTTLFVLNFVCVFITFLCIAVHSLKDKPNYSLLVIQSFLIFSLVQHQNWFWGFQLTWFMVNLFAVLSITVIHKKIRISWINLIIVILFCIISSYSSAYGLIIWIALLPSIIIFSNNNFNKVITWIVFTLLIYLLYFIDFQKNPGHTDPIQLFSYPLQAIEYFFTILGAPFITNIQISATIGVIGILFFSYFLIKLLSQKIIFKKKNKFIKNYLFCFSIIFFVLGGNLLITSGRFEFGAEQALSSRYTSLSILFWIALINIGYLWKKEEKIIMINNYENNNIFVKTYTFSKKMIPLLFLLFLSILFIYTTKSSIIHSNQRNHTLLKSKTCVDLIHVFTDNDCLKIIYPVPEIVKSHTNIMENLGSWNLSSNLLTANSVSNKYGKIEENLLHNDKLIIRGKLKRGMNLPILVSINNKEVKFLTLGNILSENSLYKILSPINNKYVSWEIIHPISFTTRYNQFQVWVYSVIDQKIFRIN